MAKWNQKWITKILLSPDFDSTLCSNSTCNKSPIRLLKGINKSTLICNKISKLPIRTQLVKSLCKRYVVGEDMGGLETQEIRGGRGTRGRRGENGKVSVRIFITWFWELLLIHVLLYLLVTIVLSLNFIPCFCRILWKFFLQNQNQWNPVLTNFTHLDESNF